jgi:hypothetical protein
MIMFLVHNDFYSIANGSCFMVNWIFFFQKQPFGGKPNTSMETMAFINLTTIDLLYFIMCEDPL